MKIFSMFSGIGGFEKGILDVWEEAEFVGHSEIDKYADMVYKYKYPECKNYGDATKIDTKELPNIDMICGGFPCQSFSIAGKRGGINNDTRGTLFKEIMRITEEKRPGILFLENVKGLLSSNQGWDFFLIVDTMVQLGYRVEWEVLNTKNFGIPQNRERVFIVGYLAEGSSQEIFPIGEISGEINESSIKAGRTKSKTAICGTLTQGSNNNDTGTYIKDKFGMRRLTPIEHERLQGFPDNWTKYGIDKSGKKIEILDSQRYKMCGNAVSIPVISAVAEKLKKVYNEKA